jgi:hypothetical protein
VRERERKEGDSNFDERFSLGICSLEAFETTPIAFLQVFCGRHFSGKRKLVDVRRKERKWSVEVGMLLDRIGMVALLGLHRKRGSVGRT